MITEGLTLYNFLPISATVDGHEALPLTYAMGACVGDVIEQSHLRYITKVGHPTYYREISYKKQLPV